MARVDHWADVRDRTWTVEGYTKPKPKDADLPIADEDKTDHIGTALVAIEERNKKIDALCLELQALCAASDPFQGVKIAKAVAKAHGITFADMVSHRRATHLVRARQHAMWLMKENTTLSLPHIAKILGGRDHTTILHGIKQHQKRLDNAK